jgi:hypothetical protein
VTAGQWLAGVEQVDGGVDDGRNSELPWASVFDPAANARALTAIQTEGFKAASQIVDRFVRIASNGLNGDGRPASPDPPLGDDQRANLFGATDVEPLIRSWWSIVGQLFVRGAPPPTPTEESAEAATLDFSHADARGELCLDADGAGPASAEVWLHNAGPNDIGEVRLRCSDLLSADGAVVRSTLMSLNPATVSMPARSSRGVDVKVELPHALPLGLYRGTLLVEGHPQLWLPVVLTVGSSPS